MNAFNFLEDAPVPLSARLAEFELGAAGRRALLGLFFSVVCLALAVGVERLRLSNSFELERRQEARLQNADESVRALRISLETVARLSAVARRVRSMQASGAGRAREIAEIAASLPQDVWLTSLARDDGGVTLKGGARDFAALGRTIARLSAIPAFAKAQLIGSRLRDPERFETSAVDFELNLQERAR